MIFEEPTIAYCYLFVVSLFLVSLVRIFSVRQHYKQRLNQLISERE